MTNEKNLSNVITPRRFINRFGIVIAFFALSLILSFASEYFLTTGNITNVLRQTSINGILALGMTCVILTGGIDLSVGSVVALSGVVSASFATRSTLMMVDGAPYPLLLVLCIGIAVGAACGAINGVLIAYFRIPAFVTTLGMLSAARGMTELYTNGQPVPNLAPSFRFIGTGLVYGIPLPVIIFLSLCLVIWILLKKTCFGRYIYAVGGNERSARTSGINTKRIIFSVYVISGAMAGLAGMILAARTGSALVQAGIAYELDAIAAVVIGGTSLSGGVGSSVYTLFGAMIIGVMNNGLDLLGVQSFYQKIVKGIIIVLAVLLDGSRKNHDN
ncbi:MAG: ABC transporter permease [Alphaproteobacteria bacterium]